MEQLLAIGQLSQSFALVLAVLVGGVWTLYRFALQRSLQSGMMIDVGINTLSLKDDHYLVAVDVMLKNVGNRLIRARQKRWYRGKQQPIYQYKDYVVYESVGLKVRRLAEPLTEGTVIIDPEQQGTSPVPGLPDEVGLTSEFEWEPRPGISKNDFFIDPGETYRLTAALVLRPGRYVAYAYVFGHRNDDEYWSRTMYFRLPTA